MFLSGELRGSLLLWEPYPANIPLSPLAIKVMLVQGTVAREYREPMNSSGVIFHIIPSQLETNTTHHVDF